MDAIIKNFIKLILSHCIKTCRCTEMGSVSFQSERQKADYLKNIFANVYLKDVIERNKIQNVDEIGILVDVLASAIGAPTNPSKIANTFASERQMTYTNKTISKHIDHLTDAFLISKAT